MISPQTAIFLSPVYACDFLSLVVSLLDPLVTSEKHDQWDNQQVHQRVILKHGKEQLAFSLLAYINVEQQVLRSGIIKISNTWHIKNKVGTQKHRKYEFEFNEIDQKTFYHKNY